MNTMEVIKDIGNYWELKDNSWSGALDTLADIEKADKEEELMQFLEEIFADRTPTETEVNDLLWHDREYIYENVGLNSNGEIPNALDEAREEGTTWLLNLEDVDNMKSSELFDQKLLVYLTNEIKDDVRECASFDVDELDANSENVITAEQIEWLNENT